MQALEFLVHNISANVFVWASLLSNCNSILFICSRLAFVSLGGDSSSAVWAVTLGCRHDSTSVVIQQVVIQQELWFNKHDSTSCDSTRVVIQQVVIQRVVIQQVMILLTSCDSTSCDPGMGSSKAEIEKIFSKVEVPTSKLDCRQWSEGGRLEVEGSLAGRVFEFNNNEAFSDPSPPELVY